MKHFPDGIAASTPNTHAPSNANEAAYLVLGNPSNVVTNGAFDADSDWAKGANWTIGSGVATRTGSGGDLTQTNALIVGNYYLVIFEMTARTAGTIRPETGTANGASRNAVGVFAEVLQCAGNTTLTMNGNAAFAGSIDNVIVYDLTSDADEGFVVVDGIQGSYDVAPGAAGNISVASSAGIFFAEAIPLAGSFQFPEDDMNPEPFLYSVQNKPLVIVLDDGGTSEKGKINAQVR